jgi:hypothetical protein
MIVKEFVLKKGQRERFYFNVQDDSIVLSEQSGIEVYYVKKDHWEPLTIDVPLKAPLPYEGLFSCLATDEGNGIARIEHRETIGSL